MPRKMLTMWQMSPLHLLSSRKLSVFGVYITNFLIQGETKLSLLLLALRMRYFVNIILDWVCSGNHQHGLSSRKIEKGWIWYGGGNHYITLSNFNGFLFPEQGWICFYSLKKHLICFNSLQPTSPWKPPNTKFSFIADIVALSALLTGGVEDQSWFW